LTRPIVSLLTLFFLFGCPENLGDRCGDGLPPCSAEAVCRAGVCVRSNGDSDAGQPTDGGADAGQPTDGGADAGQPTDSGADAGQPTDSGADAGQPTDSGADAGEPSDGGSNADGGDAGSALRCDGGCAPWAVCVAAACVNGRLEVSEPSESLTVAAGQPVPATARFVLVDGGAWPETLAIPVSASWGPQTPLLNGGAGVIPGLTDAGQGTLVFGWDGGPSQRRNVSFTACAAELIASCDAFLECAPSALGGTCVSRGFVVEWLSPDSGTATNQATVQAELSVTKPDGGAVTLTAVPVSGLPPFTGASGRYSGLLPIGAPDGLKTFTAGWPSSGPSSTLSIQRDTVAPTVTVTVEPRTGADGDAVDPTAWKLDELALVKVNVDGGRAAELSDLALPDGGSGSISTSCQSCQGQCRCFGLDLSRTAIRGLRDNRWIQVVPILDGAGNASQPVDAGVRLTRLLWQRDISLADAGLALRPLAISQEGQVVAVVPDRPGALPRVLVFTQRGVPVTVPAITGSISSGPVVAGSTIWVGESSAGGRSLTPVVLSGLPSPSVCSGIGTSFRQEMAVISTFGREVPVTFDDNGLVLGFGGCSTFSIPVSGSGFFSLATRDSPSGVFVLGGGGLTKVGLDGGAWYAEGSISAGVLDVGSRPRSLFLDENGRVGGSSGDGAFGLFATQAGGTLSNGGVVNRVADDLGAVSVAQGAVLGMSNANTLVEYRTVGAGGSLDAGVRTLSPVLSQSEPILGADGWVYIVGARRSGSTVFLSVAAARRPGLEFAWVGDLLPDPFSTSSRLAVPALDVYRTSTGAKACGRPTGVLYVFSSTDVTATLQAVLVDSNGLDSTAPWPKFQRDNANRGNSSLPTTAWTCP